MNCRQCGQRLTRADLLDDGRCRCPQCGRIYRIKSQNTAAASQSAASKQAHSRRDRRREDFSRRKLILIAAGLCVLLVVLGLTLIPSGADKASVEPSPSPAPTLAVTPLPTATPEPTAEPIQAANVHFRAVGDVMSHKLQLTHAKQDDGSYNYDSQFQYVKEALACADYTIANLELSISTDGEYSSFPFFRTPEAILDTLKDCGVDMFTMANNHILDGFWDGLTHTLDCVDERNFDHVGAYRTREEAAAPLVKDIGGIRFGFLAYTKDVNDNDKRLSGDQASYCVKLLSEADFKADVQALRDLGAEVVICMPHWGEEEKRSVTGECKRYAQQMVEAGVDIILGSHPHVVLPIDVGEMEVNGEKKDVLIAWSMGNFISYMAAKYMDSGIIVDFTVTRDENGKISIHDVGYVPVYVWGNKNRFHLICSGDFYSDQPENMSDDDFKRMRQSVKEIADMIGQDGVTLLQH